MSEEGWRGFLAAEGVDTGSCCMGARRRPFRVVSLREAARLAEAVAKAPGIAGAGVLLTLADTLVTVRLSRDVWGFEPRTFSSRGPSQQLRANTVQYRIVRPSMKCRSRLRRSGMSRSRCRIRPCVLLLALGA